MDTSSTITRSIATLSWIDPITKLPEVDRDPGDSVLRAGILARIGYRFANFVEVWVKVWKGTIVGHGITDQSGIYRAPSYLEVPSEEFPIKRGVEADHSRVKYRQLVGARTQTPEVIAKEVGGLIAGVRGMREIGRYVGREIIEEIVCFPPIWTEVELTVYADGWYETRLIRHSLFPSMHFYCQNLMIKPVAGLSLLYDPSRFSVRAASQGGSPHRIFADSRELRGASFADPEVPTYRKVSGYDGVPYMDKWLTDGWGSQKDVDEVGPGRLRGNPWSIEDPRGRLGVGR